ncbi:MAG: AMP-binding protein [Phycisphaerales bacterium]
MPSQSSRIFAEESLCPLHERLDGIASAIPDAPAVADADGELNYRDLSDGSRRIASSLLEEIGCENQSVALLFGRGAQQQTATMGVFRAGHRAVPLDASYPLERLRLIVEASQTRVILADAENMRLAESLLNPHAVARGFDALHARGDAERDFPAVDVNTPSLIIYTSGSTGIPKGAVHTHCTLLHNCLRRGKATGLVPGDRHSHFEPAGFIPAVTVSMLALLNGGTVCPFDPRTYGIARLIEFVAEQRISVMRATPSLLRAIFAALPCDQHLPALRCIPTGGEVVRSSDLRAFNAHALDGCALLITYGSSETGTLAMRRFCWGDPPDNDPIGIGTPLDDVEIDIVDEATGEPAPLGNEGPDRGPLALLRQRILEHARSNGCCLHIRPGHWPDQLLFG